jgi:hypothetical protein
MLVLLMVGVLDLGRVFYRAITVVGAARAGVAYGSQSVANTTDVNGMRAAALADAQDVTGLTATPNPLGYCECPYQSPATVVCASVPTCNDGTPTRIYAEITVSGTFSPTIPYPGVPNSITLTRTARMRAR